MHHFHWTESEPKSSIFLSCSSESKNWMLNFWGDKYNTHAKSRSIWSSLIDYPSKTASLPYSFPSCFFWKESCNYLVGVLSRGSSDFRHIHCTWTSLCMSFRLHWLSANSIQSLLRAFRKVILSLTFSSNKRHILRQKLLFQYNVMIHSWKNWFALVLGIAKCNACYAFILTLINGKGTE